MDSGAPNKPINREMKLYHWRLAFYLAVAGLLWCVAVGVLLYFLPLGASGSTSPTGEEFESGERLFTLSLSSLWPLILPALHEYKGSHG